MASLEDEMSRFEQEVLGAAGGGIDTGPPPISQTSPLSTNQFIDVKAQLSNLRQQVYGSGGPPNRHNGPPRNQGPPISNGSSMPLPPPPSPLMPMSRSGPPRQMGGPHGPMGGPHGPMGGPHGPMGGPHGPMGSQHGPMGGQHGHMGGARMHMGGPPHQMGGPPNQMGGPPNHMRGPGPGGPQLSAPPRPPLGRPPAPPGFFIPHQVRPMGPPRPPANQGMISSAPVTYQKPAVIEKPPVTISVKPDIKQSVTSTTESTDLNLPESTSTAQKRNASNTIVNQDTGQGHKPQTSSGEPLNKKKKEKKDKRLLRTAANDVWEDHSLAEWDPDDFRVFCGDLGNEVTDEKLLEAFKQYPSLQKAKVVRDRKTHKTKGYGFISFSDPGDYTRAMREMNGKYVGNRPIKLRKSNWRDRSVDVVKKKEKEKKRLGFR